MTTKNAEIIKTTHCWKDDTIRSTKLILLHQRKTEEITLSEGRYLTYECNIIANDSKSQVGEVFERQLELEKVSTVYVTGSMHCLMKLHV